MKKPCTLDTIKLFFLALSPSVYQGLNQTQQPWPQLSWSHSSNSQLYPTSPQHGEDLSTHSRSPRGDPHDDPLGRAGEPPPCASPERGAKFQPRRVRLCLPVRETTSLEATPSPRRRIGPTSAPEQPVGAHTLPHGHLLSSAGASNSPVDIRSRARR